MDDPRLGAEMVVRRNPTNGRRQILVNGENFPTFTHGDIEVMPVVRWPGELDEPVVVGYEITLTCFVPNFKAQDPEMLHAIPLAEYEGPDGA